jgi:hypothetical protein
MKCIYCMERMPYEGTTCPYCHNPKAPSQRAANWSGLAMGVGIVGAIAAFASQLVPLAIGLVIATFVAPHIVRHVIRGQSPPRI